MPVTIRLATKEDADLVAAFSRQTFYETFASHNSKANMDKFMNEQFTHQNLVNEVGAKDNIFLLAFYADELVGYVRLRENNQPPQLSQYTTIEIARIYAAAQSIGKGIGRILMHHCIDMAVAMKKEVIWLGVWEHNKRAIDFYTRWGFEKFGTHVFMLGDDPQTDWLMAKKLVPVNIAT